jgi:alpha-tubulin suppressor-like RCC1 family protein
LAGLGVALLVGLLWVALFGAPVGSASVASGSLVVRLSGLPSAQQPSVVLRGPGGLRRSVPARGLTIARARVGLYRLTLGSVRITRASGAIKRGATATALVSTVSVRVLAGRRAVLQGTYAAIINPGVKELGGGVLSVVGAADDPSTVVLGGHVTLARGAILSLPPSTLLPRGLLSNVMAVGYAAGKTTVTVTAASVYQVAPNFQFDVPLAGSQASAADVTASCGPASGISPYTHITNVSFSGGWDTVSVLGVHVTDGVKAAVHFTAAAGLNVTAGAGLACSLSASFSANGMAGPIPVTASIEGELDGSAAAGGVLTGGGSMHVDAGAHTLGIPPALVWLPDVSFSNPQFTFTAQSFAQATASIGLTVKAGIGNNDLADVTLNVGTSMAFSAQPGSCTWNANFGQFSAEGQLLDWHITTPPTPALFTTQLWQSPCGRSSSGSGGSPGGSGSGGGSNGPTGTTGPTGVTDATAISSGGGDTCALLAGGGVECWGLNTFGEFGNGAIGGPDCGGGCRATPIAASGITNATQISAGGGGVCALLAGGDVECWGDNTEGELGDGTTAGPDCGGACSATPVAVSGITNATQISTNVSGACALLATGTINCWGNNTDGALGDGTIGGPDCGGGCSATPVAVSGITTAIQISTNVAATCAVLTTGSVDCWGLNTYGQLGDGSVLGPDCGGGCSATPVAVSGITNATQISTDGNDTCALLATGSVECWGDNSFGQLGNGTTTGPDCAGGHCSATPVVVSGITNATQISAGGDGVCALLATGGVTCWGDNSIGELGDGTTAGPDCGGACSATPVAVSGITNATHISAGRQAACALLATGAIQCWGTNDFGQLGNGTTISSDVPVSVISFP